MSQAVGKAPNIHVTLYRMFAARHRRLKEASKQILDRRPVDALEKVIESKAKPLVTELKGLQSRLADLRGDLASSTTAKSSEFFRACEQIGSGAEHQKTAIGEMKQAFETSCKLADKRIAHYRESSEHWGKRTQLEYKLADVQAQAETSGQGERTLRRQLKTMEVERESSLAMHVAERQDLQAQIHVAEGQLADSVQRETIMDEALQQAVAQGEKHLGMLAGFSRAVDTLTEQVKTLREENAALRAVADLTEEVEALREENAALRAVADPNKRVEAPSEEIAAPGPPPDEQKKPKHRQRGKRAGVKHRLQQEARLGLNEGGPGDDGDQAPG